MFTLAADTQSRRLSLQSLYYIKKNTMNIRNDKNENKKV